MAASVPLGAEVATPTVTRLESLTSLRFLAALAVFSLHLPLLEAGVPYARWMGRFSLPGATGVSFFFILSGFVLTWAHPPGDLARRFYRRRAARILPNHVLTWAVMALILISYKAWPGAGPALGSLFLVQAWVPIPRWYWAMNTPAWSLGCEAFFYLLFPGLRRALAKSGSAPWLLLSAAMTEIVLSVAQVGAPARPGSWGYWLVFFFPVVRLAEFVMGMALAGLVQAAALPRIPLSLAAAVVLAAYLADSWVPFAFQSGAFMLLPFWLLVLAAAQSDLSGRPRLLAARLPVLLGRWSFAFYLVHYPLLTVFGRVELHDGMGGMLALANAVGLLLGAVALSGALYRMVEQPMERRWRQAALMRGLGRVGPGLATTDPLVAP
jgi:peptidoglycan/LPS O-acetylase OafA/YrhL